MGELDEKSPQSTEDSPVGINKSNSPIYAEVPGSMAVAFLFRCGAMLPKKLKLLVEALADHPDFVAWAEEAISNGFSPERVYLFQITRSNESRTLLAYQLVRQRPVIVKPPA